MRPPRSPRSILARVFAIPVAIGAEIADALSPFGDQPTVAVRPLRVERRPIGRR